MRVSPIRVCGIGWGPVELNDWTPFFLGRLARALAEKAVDRVQISQLFAQIHGGAGALLAVAQGGVEYNYPVVFHNVICAKQNPIGRFRRWGLQILSSRKS